MTGVYKGCFFTKIIYSIYLRTGKRPVTTREILDMSQKLEERSEAPAAEAPGRRIFGGVEHGRDGRFLLGLLTVVGAFLTIVAWFVDPKYGVVATCGLVVAPVAMCCIRPMAFRVTLVVVGTLVMAVPFTLAAVADTQARVAREAIERPKREAAEAVAREASEAVGAMGFTVKTVQVDRGDPSRGTAVLDIWAGMSHEAHVVLVKVGGKWTVNCPADGGSIDITADNNKLAVALNATGRCPAGLKKSAPATP